MAAGACSRVCHRGSWVSSAAAAHVWCVARRGCCVSILGVARVGGGDSQDATFWAPPAFTIASDYNVFFSGNAAQALVYPNGTDLAAWRTLSGNDMHRYGAAAGGWGHEVCSCLMTAILCFVCV